MTSNNQNQDVEIHEHIQEEEGEAEFITEDDVLEEYRLEGHDGEPMDEDDEIGDLPDIDGNSSANTGIVEDNSVQHFKEHKSSVFTVSCHPTEPLAASGGEDDMGYIWDITDGETVVKLTGHTDSVTSIAWSHDGEMISTGGMDGKVRIWRRVGKTKGKDDYRTWEFLTELQGPDEVMVRSPLVGSTRSDSSITQFLRWHPKGSVLLAGSNDSTLWLWQCMSHSIRSLNECSFQCSTFWKYNASIRWTHRSCQLWRIHTRWYGLINSHQSISFQFPVHRQTYHFS